MPRSPAILNSQVGLGMQLFDYDSGPASATDFNLVGPGVGGGYNDLLASGPQLTNSHNADFSVNINRHNMLPNPDFIIGGGSTGITGASTGTVPKFWGAYNPTAVESCVFSYNSSAGCPIGSGGAWQLVYSTNTTLKGLYVGHSTGYSGFVLKANTTYMFSVYVSTNYNFSGGYSGQWGLNFDSGGPTYTINGTGGTGIQQYYTADTSWYWVQFVLTCGAADYTGNIYLYNQFNPSGTSQTCYIGAVKLEEGSVASQWTGAVYESGTTDFILPHPNKTIDNIADGTTRSAILNTELAGSTGAYTVKQLNDGTNVRTAANVAATIDGSANLLSNPFGVSSGVMFYNSDYTLRGFSATGLGTPTDLSYPTCNSLCVYADIESATSGGPVMISVGNTTDGFSLQVGNSNTNLYMYQAGVQSTIYTQAISFGGLNSAYIRLRLAVDFLNQCVEAVVDSSGFGGVPAFFYPASVNGTTVWVDLQTALTVTVSVNAAGTSGKVQNFMVNSRELFLQSAMPVFAAINPNYVASGNYFRSNVVQAQNVSGFTGTGAISLDNVPDGTTYKRVAATNLTNNNVNNPFNNAQCYYQNDGSINMPGSPQTTGYNFPIVAGFLLNASAWINEGGTSGAVYFLIGNETNGLGIKWTAAGALSLVTFKAGTGTAGTTFATVTRSASNHWVSVKLTPGATPGTSDAYVLYFDNNTTSGTTGSSAVTWSTNAGVTFDGNAAGGKVYGLRMASN